MNADSLSVSAESALCSGNILSYFHIFARSTHSNTSTSLHIIANLCCLKLSSTLILSDSVTLLTLWCYCFIRWFAALSKGPPSVISIFSACLCPLSVALIASQCHPLKPKLKHSFPFAIAAPVLVTSNKAFLHSFHHSFRQVDR